MEVHSKEALNLTNNCPKIYCYCFIASILVPQVLQNDAKGRSLPNCPDSFAIFSSSTIAASKSVRMRRRSSTGPGGDVSEGVSCSSRCQRQRNLTPNKSAKVTSNSSNSILVDSYHFFFIELGPVCYSLNYI